MKILGIQCYQDYNVCYYDTDTKKIKYLELDKMLKQKHFSFHSDILKTNMEVDNIYKDNMHNNLYKVQKLVKEYFNVKQFDYVAWCYTQFADGYLKKESRDFVGLLEQCPISNYHHQENHILPTIFVNKLSQALCISIDGKGDGNHDAYVFRKGKLMKLFQEKKFSYGMFYEVLASNFLKTKYYEGIEGKFMAFAGMSNKFVELSDIKQFMEHVKSVNWNIWEEKIEIEKYINEKINNWKKTVEEYDLAYTLQSIWIDDIMSFIEQYKEYSNFLVFSGGCSLNCMLNYKLVKSKWFDKIYWNPVASDTGQSLGAVYHLLFTDNPKELQYIDVNNFYCTDSIFDKQYFNDNIAKKMEKLNTKRIVQALFDNKIIGVCRGNIEMGPRALGHRSILASPLTKQMHDTLNEIKNREWYRPYGIIIPREYLSKYFDIDVDAKYMNILAWNPTGVCSNATAARLESVAGSALRDGPYSASQSEMSSSGA